MSLACCSPSKTDAPTVSVVPDSSDSSGCSRQCHQFRLFPAVLVVLAFSTVPVVSGISSFSGSSGFFGSFGFSGFGSSGSFDFFGSSGSFDFLPSGSGQRYSSGSLLLLKPKDK